MDRILNVSRRSAFLAARRLGKTDLLRAQLGVDDERLLRRALQREAPFAGLYVLAGLSAQASALPALISRLRAGEPLRTRLDFVNGSHVTISMDHGAEVLR